MSNQGTDVSQFLTQELMEENERYKQERDDAVAREQLLRDTVTTKLDHITLALSRIEAKLAHDHTWSQSYSKEGILYVRCLDPDCNIVRYA